LRVEKSGGAAAVSFPVVVFPRRVFAHQRVIATEVRESRYVKHTAHHCRLVRSRGIGRRCGVLLKGRGKTGQSAGTHAYARYCRAYVIGASRLFPVELEAPA